jgi:cysteinyl-tRNA synthetase
MRRKIILFNTLAEKSHFRTVIIGFVRIYDCGPTVFSFAHIGNLWRYRYDFLRRVLEYNDLK